MLVQQGSCEGTTLSLFHAANLRGWNQAHDLLALCSLAVIRRQIGPLKQDETNNPSNSVAA